MKILIIIDFRPRLLRACALGQKTLARRWAWDFEVNKWEDHVRQKWVPDLEALGQYLSRTKGREDPSAALGMGF